MRKHSYSKEDLVNAVVAVQNGMSYTDASKKYKVPKTTISDRVKGRGESGRKMGVSSLPSTLELTCDSDSLSDVQLSFQQKINDDLKKLSAVLKLAGIDIPDNPSSPVQTIETITTSKAKNSTKQTNGTSNNTTNATTISKGRPKRKVPTPNYGSSGRSSSPEIEVLEETRPSKTSRSASPTQFAGTTGRGGGSNVPLTPLPPSSARLRNMTPLCIVVRPRNFMAPSKALQKRKELDLKVKGVLMKSPQDFVEWLLTEGMIRVQQYCSVHKSHPTNQPLKLKLGIFSDPKVLSTSGGYVWISECCGKKYVSVFSGSILGSTPIDKVPPQAVLKLVYHWSCQTSVPNVESWVKVEKIFVNKMYNYLRCICTVMLQDKVYDFGFDYTAVELGIVSLGTSTADGSKKSVKVEILGLYDRKMKSYRLFASCPEPSNTSQQRFARILKPIEQIVHRNATIICDQSIDRNCLHYMNYPKVSLCDSSEDESNTQANGTIMFYLRKHVPKLFQSALSQLNLEQVQLILDELCWRERFGVSSAHCFNNMLEHIVYLTSRETENPGLLHLLDYVSVNPQKNWRYKTVFVTRGPLSIQPSVINNSNLTTPTPPHPIRVNQKEPTSIITSSSMLSGIAKYGPSSPAVETTATEVEPSKSLPITSNDIPKVASNSNPPTELESYFYGIIPGNPLLGQEPNTCEFKCHLCTATFMDNIKFYTHLKWHLTGKFDTERNVLCPYCVEAFMSEDELKEHIVVHVPQNDPHLWCKICLEKFTSENQIILHMTRKHYEAELPYRCEVCQFGTSIQTDMVDHFNQKHQGTPYIMCHLCLSVKAITPQGSPSFSFRLYQHLQKHTQKNKCKSCILIFYSKYMLQEHKNKDHISCARYSALEKYKGSQDPNATKILFRPAVKQTIPITTNRGISDQHFLKPSIAMSKTVNDYSNLKFDIDKPDSKCIECDLKMNLENHYRFFQKCVKCPYSTCCHQMICHHNQVFHPSGKRGSKPLPYVLGTPVKLPSPLFCICGFSTSSGNHLARHLVLCEGGRKSAYPTYANAMGITENPSLDEYLAAARAISTREDDSSSPPPQDLTAFMTMNMEVEEPPTLPLSVELDE